MKKISLTLAILVASSSAMLIFTSCNLVNRAPTSESPPKPVPTITTTATITVTPPPITTVQTVTATPPPVTVTVSPSPSPTIVASPENTPVISSIEANNNPHFFTGQNILGYTQTMNAGGSITQTPVTQDLYSDLVLGGFYNQNDATFVPHIPSITNQDAWILKFTVPTFKLPVDVNWGYVAKPNTNPTLSLTIFTFGDFKSRYIQNPYTLNNAPGIASENYISRLGVHLQYLRDEGDYIIYVQTNNADNILGWWLKFGGIKF